VPATAMSSNPWDSVTSYERFFEPAIPVGV